MLELYGKDAKKTLEKLLKEDLITFMASDVHRPNSIYNTIDQALEKTKQIVGEKKLKELTTINPGKVILNETI